MNPALAMALAALALLPAGCGGEDGRPAQPGLLPVRPGAHVVVVSFDALRPDALGAYGRGAAVSPHLDAFAEQAVVFENAYSSAPKTPTSFAAAFTGRWPSRVFRD